MNKNKVISVRTQNFLDVELDNFDWIKEFSKKELKNEIDFEFKTKPYKHQLACFMLGALLDKFAFYAGMGAGKSKLILDLISYRILHRDEEVALVVVPKEINIITWENEIKEHSDLKFEVLSGHSSKKLEVLRKNESELYLVTYQGFVRMLIKEIRINGKMQWKVNQKLVAEISRSVDIVVLDEVHKVKNKSTKIFMILRNLSKSVKGFYIMSGTPFGKDLEDLWPQFYLLDNGETLGDTLGVFREAFSDQKDGWFGPDRFVTEEGKLLIKERIKNRSIVYLESELDDLPKLKMISVKLIMGKEQYDFFEENWNNLLQLQGNIVEQNNSYVTLRRACSGYSVIETEDEKIVYNFESNPKLEWLEEFLQDLGDEKVLIFYVYNATGDLLEAMYKRLKVNYSRVDGTIKKKKQRTEFKKFLDNDKCKVLSGNVESIGTGINPQKVCRYGVFFELPESVINRLQAVKRLHRSGQKWKVFIYDLVFNNKIDQGRLETYEEGKTLREVVFDE